MKRQSAICLVVLLCTPIVAQATVTVTAPTFVWVQPAVIDILINADAGEVVNSMDFKFNVAAGGPVITDISFVTPGALFDPATSPDSGDAGTAPDGTTQFAPSGYGTTSASRSVGFVATNLGADVPIGTDQLVAKVSLNWTAVPPGSYIWAVDPSVFFIADTQSSDYELVSVPGGFSIPEPSSVVLALFSAAGLAAVVMRRMRRGNART